VAEISEFPHVLRSKPEPNVPGGSSLAYLPAMAMLRVCVHPGCGTFTLGELCLEHEQSPAQRLDRPRARTVPVLANGVRTQRHVPDAKGKQSGV